MNWYHKYLIKIAASPKNIVNSWKVDDPFLKFFIYTYEPLIDLSEIKSKEDLNRYIQSSLIPSLKEKIDINSPNGYYKKNMTDEEALAEIDEHEADPRTQQAIQVFKNDPKSAKKILLKAINEDKKISFDRWWEYMSDYTNSPAFFYSMLNPMIESSPSEQKNGPPPANRKAIALIKDEIQNKGVTQMNILKKFVKNSFKLDEKDSKDDIIEVGDDKKWIRIDSKLRDPENYKKNQEKLMRYATGTGWCIARNHYSDLYLSKGDFWLYFEKDKPKIAIRLVGNSSKGENKVAEIRGLHNKEKNSDPYWEQVTTFLHNTDFDYGENSHYQRLRGILEKNIDLKKLEVEDPQKFQEIYNGFLNAIVQDPTQLGQMSKENRKNYPELTQYAAKGYEKRIDILLKEIENLPPKDLNYQSKFSDFQDELNAIPDDVKPYMSDNLDQRLITVHKKVFMNNPLEYEFFPDDMKAAITPEEQRQAWTKYVGQDPYRYNDTRIPIEVRKFIPLKPILQAWADLINTNIAHVDNIPSFILNIKNSKGQRFFPENYIENKIIADFIKYPCSRTSEGYDRLRRIKDRNLLTDDQIISVYKSWVEKQYNNKNISNPILYVPIQYREAVSGTIEDKTPLAQKHYQRIISDARYFNPITDKSIRNILLTDNKYKNGVISSFLRLREQGYKDNWNGFWKDLPDDVKNVMPDSVKQSVANVWVPYVSRNPSLLNNLDNIIRPIVESRIQKSPAVSNYNWYRRLLK
jgi:hypothetical protein